MGQVGARIDSIYIDDLTGVLNRRYLYDHLGDEVEIADREGKSLWLALIDVDDFKAINDTYGHLEGDSILREVASIFRRSIRVSDKVIRFGGDEFVLLLMDGGLVSALTVLKRIRENIARQRFSTGISGLTIEVTISIGLAGYPDDTSDPSKLLNLADEALYVSKKRGKSGVSLVSDIPASTLLSRDILELFPAKTVVGRERELEEISDFFVDRNRNFLIITSPFGVGKSRLIKEIEQLSLMEGFIPMVANAYGSKWPILLELWQHFEVNYLDVYTELLETLPSDELDKLKKIMIEKVELQKGFTIASELFNLVTSNYRVAFFIDDVFYADEETLWYVFRMLAQYPGKVKLVVTMDSDYSLDTPATELIETFKSKFDWQQVTLSGFSAQDVSRYIKTVFGEPLISPSVVDLLWEISHGNVMFLEELLKYLMAKKFIYKIHQKWIVKGYEDIRKEIQNDSFHNLVEKRILSMDAVLKEEIFKLKMLGKDISNIWKSDIGVVRKGYLLDLVKALHRDKLLKDRQFYIEDYPNIAVKEMYEILAHAEGGNSGQVSALSVDEGCSGLSCKWFQEFMNRDFVLSCDEDKFCDEVVSLLNAICSILSVVEVGGLRSSSIVVEAKRCEGILRKLLDKTFFLEISFEGQELLVNKVRFTDKVDRDLVEKLRNFLKLQNRTRLRFIRGVSHHHISFLGVLNYLSVNCGGKFLINCPYISLEQVDFTKDEVLSFITEGESKLISSILGAVNVSVALYLATLKLDAKIEEREKILDALCDVLLTYSYVYRCWLMGCFLSYLFYGFPRTVKDIINKLPPRFTALQLSILCRYGHIPLQFVCLIEQLLPGQLCEEFKLGLDADALRRMDFVQNVCDGNTLLGMPDIDRWGVVVSGKIEEIFEKLGELPHIINLFVDSLEMSLGNKELLLIIAPWVPKLVDLLYLNGYQEVAFKIIRGFINGISNNYKESPERIVWSLSETLVLLFEHENNPIKLYQVLKRLKTNMFRLWEKVMMRVSVVYAGFSLVDKFLLYLHQGFPYKKEFVHALLYLGDTVVQYLVKKLVLCDDVTSLGYFDLFWARKIVGEQIKAHNGHQREQLVLFLIPFLKNELWFVVRNAIELLSYIIKPSEVSIFRPLIDYPNIRVTKRLVFILSRMKTRESDLMLLELFRKVQDSELKGRIYNILKKSKYDDILDEVRQIMAG